MPAEDYQIDCHLGRGSFGEVYKAVNLKTNEVYALKMINLDEASEINDLIKEIHFLSRNQSKYLTKHFETFLEDTNMWIVLEYCGGGSCADLLKCFGKLNEEVTAYIIRDVLKGLEYLHQQKKVHRDVKLANILLTDQGEVKLADFGVSGEMTMTRTRRNTLVGTPYWMAPEVITRSEEGYNSKADIWYTGITTIELVKGKPPLSQFDPMKALFEIPKKKPPALEGKHHSGQIKNFVRYCLVKMPGQRPNASTLLHHQFITSCPNISLVDILSAKRIKEAKKSPLQPRQRKVNRALSIKWNLTTFRPSEKVHLPWESRYGGMLYDSLTKVMNRATTDLARVTVLKLREDFSAAEVQNAGLSHAFVEELHQLMDEKLKSGEMSSNKD